jgi:hypothetical protein
VIRLEVIRLEVIRPEVTRPAVIWPDRMAPPAAVALAIRPARLSSGRR